MTPGAGSQESAPDFHAPVEAPGSASEIRPPFSSPESPPEPGAQGAGAISEPRKNAARFLRGFERFKNESKKAEPQRAPRHGTPRKDTPHGGREARPGKSRHRQGCQAGHPQRGTGQGGPEQCPRVDGSGKVRTQVDRAGQSRDPRERTQAHRGHEYRTPEKTPP